MNTPSHFLINLAMKSRRDQRHLPIAGRAFLLGSVLPDVPLFFLTVGYIVYRRFVPIDESVFGATYDQLFFENPFWITAYNVFHAPPMLMAIGLLGVWLRKHRRGPWGSWLIWFALGCATHAAIDIATHHDDGPLLLFPFNWSLRFISPISYWDTDHYGRTVAAFELLLDAGILVWLFRQRRMNKER